MSNTDNALPEELKAKIEKDGLQFCRTDEEISNHWTGYSRTALRSYIAGATEYAQYKVKFERATDLLHSVVADLEMDNKISASLFREIKSFLNGSK